MKEVCKQNNPTLATKRVKGDSLKILAIVGSPRPKGNTNYLIDRALEEVSKLGIVTEKIVLSDFQMNPCLGHDNCASLGSCLQKDDTSAILEKFCQADGVILATPVYYFNVTAQMKTFMDRTYFLYTKSIKSRAKTVGIIVVANSEGIEDTLHTMRQFVDESFDIEDSQMLIVTGYAGRLGDVKNNSMLVADARNLGKRMVEVLKR
jgi:multimeric flavodoxin WrbA